MKLAKLLILFMAICIALPMHASPVRVNSTGAAKSTINLCALRDKYGFLWVGTTTGLACFDGNGKAVNNTPTGILRSTTNLRVTKIFEFGDNLLFATPNRLMLFDRKNKTTYRLPVKTKYNVEISSQVNNICKGPGNSNDIWIATQGQGLFKYNPDRKELIQYSKHGSFYSDVTLCDNGFIYASTLNGEIHKYKANGEFVSSYRIPNYTQGKTTINLESDGSQLWISSGSDLYCLNTATNEILHKTSVPSFISSLIKNANKSLILATGAGIMKYDIASNSLTPLKEVETGLASTSGFLSSKVNHLSPTPEGGVLTVRQSGEILELFALDNRFKFIPITDKFDGNIFVHALTPDFKGTGLWVGSDNGLSYFNTETGVLSTPAIAGLGKEAITSITTDGDKVWIGTANNGLFLYHPESGQTQHFRHDENTPYSLLSDEVDDVFVTTGGITYIFTRWGLCRYNPVKNEFNTMPEVGQQTEVVAMAEYYDGGLWAATVNNGLLYMKPGDNRFEYVKSKNLEGISINHLLMTRNGSLWAASQSDGLFIYNKETNDFDPYKLPLLSNRSILALQEDNNGGLLIVTDESIIRISKDGEINSSYKYFAPSLGMKQPLVLLRNGDMALGGNNGFQIFNPGRLSFNKNVAAFPTTLDFPFDEDPKTREDLGLSILLYTTDKITLPYDHNSFTIHLAANHPTDMPTITYDYMLEGLDKDWNIGSQQAEVTYNNLRPGTYHFLVRPSGLTGVETKSLTIVISPPWYLTIWAYIGYALLLILIGFSAWYLIRKRVRKHYERRMESIKIQRERESWESKMRFFVDLVHEIRTPLMLISLPMDHLSKRFKNISSNYNMLDDRQMVHRELSKDKRYLEAMQTNLDYLLSITNEILDFRKVDNGTEQSICPAKCDVSSLISELRERFEKTMETEGKQLIVNLPAEPITAEIDRVKVDRVMMNLMGNARKYCKTTTTVSLSADDKDVIITISDDGPGIPEKERPHIFDLYYQIKDDKLAASLGTGLGLAYAGLIAKAHGGEITVGETAEGGALFILRLPKKSTVEAVECQETYELPETNQTSIIPDDGESTPKDSDDISTILVVDDNIELLDMITDGLNGKYNILKAGDGIEALEQLKNNDVDFIVSDVMMPRMDGMELLKKVKENINYSHIPFIILTAKTTRESREEGYESGADIYLDKPFSIRALINQIENMRRTRQYFYRRFRGSEPLSNVGADANEAIEENKLPALGKYDREFLEKMEKIMAENISDETFSIDTLAERLNMSRSSFYRKIKALMGMTPVDYMKNYRLDVAAQQLRDKIRINEVVANVGFTSHSYFAKCFKEKYGVLPRDFS